MRLILFFLVSVAQLCAQTAGTCSCTGVSSNTPLEGGDGKPLHWRSLKRLVTPENNDSTAWYCFERRVDNNSDRDVTDVFWKVAGFEKDEIPEQDSRCDAATLQGEKKPHPQGPLYYNVGDQPYKTSAYAPEDGFEDATAKVMKPVGTPELTSEIEISDPVKKTKAKITFRSSVTPSPEGNRFDYEVTSSASVKVLVFWYVPLTDDFRSLEMNRTHPLTAAPKETQRRSARSSDPVGWTAASVQIFDFDRRWIATGRASVYCSQRGQTEPLIESAPGKRAALEIR